MNAYKTLRVGDCTNYPEKGDMVGVHYIIKDQEGLTIESTYEWGRIF